MAGSNFGTALRHMRNGHTVTRNVWTGTEKETWVLYIRKDKILLSKEVKKTEEWVPTQEEILATDWYITF